MVMQAFLVAFLLGLASGKDLVVLGRHLWRQQTVTGAASGFTVVRRYVEPHLGTLRYRPKQWLITLLYVINHP